MTTRGRTQRMATVLGTWVLLTGCGAQHPAHGRRQLAAVADSPSPYSAQPTSSIAAPAGADPAAGAVTVSRAFTGEICPYSWRDSRPYGQRLNTALTRWGTPPFVAAHRWSPARIATATAGLAQDQAEQVCGPVTGGPDPETTAAAAGRVAVRLSVTVTAHSATGPASSAQQTFTFQLVHLGARWLINNGQW
jgi:hypothetical protein